MQDTEEAPLFAAYHQAVALIRAFEPQLGRRLLDPLTQMRGVIRVDWRIKTWEGARAKISAMRDTGRASFGVANVSDLLGVRVVIEDPKMADAICRMVGEQFQILDDVRYHSSGGRQKYHREHLIVTTHSGDTSISFELQIISQVAQALVDAEHALQYGEDYTAPLASNMSSVTLGEASSRQISRAVADALTATANLDDIIAAFEKMIADPGIHEKRDIHPYLDKHRFLLHAGPDSIVSEPAIGLGTQYRPDFIIREPTGEYILVELENPRHVLFNKKGHPRAQVTHATQQVEDWQEWIEQNIQTVQRSYPDLIAPEGWVVIGRSASMDSAHKQKLSRRNINTRGKLKIETYDEIIARAQAYVEGIRRALNSA